MHVKERFQNNYDFLRIFAALCIILFHSFALLGKIKSEPLFEFTKGRINFSFIGLSIFFCISGYLIAKSAVKSPTVKNYLWKRFLRIQPLLIVTCILTIFLLGPFFTELSLKNYFLDYRTYTYFRNVLPIFGLQFTLPGLFHNLTDRGVNGSLWTLIVEERLYLLMAIIFLYRKDKAWYLFFLIILINIVFIINRFFFYGEMIPYLSGSPFFYSLLFLNSAALYLIKFDFSRFLIFTIVTATFCFFMGIVFPNLDILYMFSLPLLIISVGKIKGATNYFGKYGDFTYGTYVFSFPVQQALITKGITNPYALFFLTLLIVLPMAILSWNFIEKEFLKLKKFVK